MYVADSDNNRIQKFDSNGNFITKWGYFGEGNGQFNSGNNALGQDSGNGNGNGGSNSAKQSKSQSQSSSPNSQVVSGDDTIGSGNNVNIQSQVNTGNNAAAQQ